MSRPLDVINVARPCTADWNQMEGDEKRRFCEHCQKHVYYLGAMPEDEAERLICQRAGSMCVRFARDPETNAVMTLNYAPKKQYSRRRAIATMAAIATAFGSVAAWAGFTFLRKAPPPPMMIVGDIGPALPPVAPSAPNQ
jgi:hypothetical protein